MTKIRTKDRLFLAVVVPLAVTGVYFCHFRPAASAKLESLRARDRATVTHEDYPGEKRIRQAALKEAEAALAAERSKKPPETEVVADAGEPPARRTQNVVATFRGEGVRVVSVSLSDAGGNARAAAVLRATRARPSPIGRIYRLEGGFIAVKRALETFTREKSALVVTSLESEGTDKWKVEIYE